MDTVFIVPLMVAVSVLLLAAAIIADRKMAQHRERRASSPESRKRDSADAVIELLDRTGDLVRRSLQTATDDEQGRP